MTRMRQNHNNFESFMRRKKTKKTHPKKSPVKKRWLIPVLVIAILVGLYGAYIFQLSRYKLKFESFLKEAIQSDVSIGSIRLKFLGDLAIKLNDVAIKKADQKDCTLEADQILFDVKISDLISKNLIHISAITVVRPHIKICKDFKGNWQIPGLYDSSQTSKKYAYRNDSRPLKVRKASLLPSLPSYQIDYSSFYINKLFIDDATIEIINHKLSETFLLKHTDIQLGRQSEAQAFDISVNSQIQHDPKSRILFTGSVSNLEADLSTISLSDLVATSSIQGNLSIATMSPLDMGALIDINKLPSAAKDMIFYASCSIDGTYMDGLSLRGRLHPTRLPRYKEVDIDFDVSVCCKKPFITANKLITFVDGTEIIVDGSYDLLTNQGLFYLQTNKVDIHRLGNILSFVKRLDLSGTTSVSAELPVYNFSLHPSMIAYLYLTEFTGNFKRLAYPLVLRKPTTGILTSHSLSFHQASVSYKDRPVILDFTYSIDPEKKISIQYNELSDMQLLDIIAINKPKQDNTTAEEADKDTSDAKSQQSVSKPKRDTRPKRIIPIYINGPVQNVQLGAVAIDSGYLDALIEGNRILFKNIDLRMYGGHFRGNGVIKTIDTTPSYAIVADVRDLAINDILTDTTKYSDLLDGTFSSAISFQCSGKTISDIQETLTSHGVIKIQDGVIHNLALLEEILANFSDESKDKRLKLYGSTIGLRIPSVEEFGFEKETSFSELRCAYNIKENENGVNAFQTDNLTIESPKMKIKLKGGFDFNQNLDFTGMTTLSEIQTNKLLSKVRELSMLFAVSNQVMEIPFKIEGTIQNPEPIPIIRLNMLQNKVQDLLQNKLFRSKSEDINIDAIKKEPLEPNLEKKIDQLDIDEDDMKRLKKLEKKIKKYLD